MSWEGDHVYMYEQQVRQPAGGFFFFFTLIQIHCLRRLPYSGVTISTSDYITMLKSHPPFYLKNSTSLWGQHTNTTRWVWMFPSHKHDITSIMCFCNMFWCADISYICYSLSWCVTVVLVHYLDVLLGDFLPFSSNFTRKMLYLKLHYIYLKFSNVFLL